MQLVDREDGVFDEQGDEAVASPLSGDVAAVPRKTFTRRKLLRGVSIYFEAASPRDVVLINAVASGCRVVHDIGAADLIWIEALPWTADSLRAMAYQRVNFFPGMKIAATKCEFARLMGRVSRLYPGDFPFIPRTFALPAERQLLDEFIDAKAAAAPGAKKKPSGGCGGVFVVKPSAGCGGDGIYLTNDLKNIKHPECVVQEYIANPLTIGGLKFDFRLYVLVTSVNPLRFYLHREGLGRMAVEPYEAPGSDNFYKLNMHLTNYSLNKFSSKFVENMDALDDAHTTKRRATTAFRQLSEEYAGFDYETVWTEITVLVSKVMGAITPHLLASAGEIPGRTSYLSRCFQLIGFDVLLDRDFKPHLLEINHHPSLQTDAPIDMYVKSKVVRPLVCMVAQDALRARVATAAGGAFQGPLPPADAAEWEAQFIDPAAGWCPGLVEVDSIATERYVRPMLPLLRIFADGCGASSRKYEALSSSRFSRLMRAVGLCGPGAPFSSADVDLMFIQCLKRRGGGNTLDFYDFVDAVMSVVGDRVSPGTSSWTLARLEHVSSVLSSRTAAA